MSQAAYSRSQLTTALWIIMPLTLGVVGTALFIAQGAAAWPALLAVALVHLLPLLLLGRLTVEVSAEAVAWRFGWLGWPRWREPLHHIAAVEVTTSKGLEGWGIQRTRAGMLYNASGTRAVRLQLKNGRSLRLGSDEPERLASFIRARLPRTP